MAQPVVEVRPKRRESNTDTVRKGLNVNFAVVYTRTLKTNVLRRVTSPPSHIRDADDGPRVALIALELGNSLLGKFGMSLDNFKAEKDPSTGSYNISFGR